MTNNLSKMNQTNSDFAFNDQYNLIEKFGKLNKELNILNLGANEGKISQKYGELFKIFVFMHLNLSLNHIQNLKKFLKLNPI